MWKNLYDNKKSLRRALRSFISEHRTVRIDKTGPSKSFKMEYLIPIEFWNN